MNSIIGAVGGGLGGGLMAFFFVSWILTNNTLYLGLVPISFIIDLLAALFLVDKYVKVALENSMAQAPREPI